MNNIIKRFSPSRKNSRSGLSDLPEIKMQINKTINQISLASWLDEHAYTRSIESILQKDGSIRLIGEKLEYLPDQILLVCGPLTTSLNLSDNNFSDLTFLSHFGNLHTLIFNKNYNLNELTLPYMPTLRALWLNNCGISNIIKWVKRIKIQCPNLVVLSISNQGNIESAMTSEQLRLKIIHYLPNLCILDNIEVTKDEIFEAFPLTENVFNRVVSKFRRSWAHQSSPTTDKLISNFHEL
ncbi:uncharacterized protein LOC129612685 isoform X2 [Condylostylus longicornis]|uniref:uncharacterized protein LOC129612685 isoform X2 n=1 Tax=Condylostylus longicornis TaxID=2530218 RepID=UPI00244DCAE7|nr:uncharacterized protein LOC129612685 isoform X2 [Condylostylus longicornis]